RPSLVTSSGPSPVLGFMAAMGMLPDLCRWSGLRGGSGVPRAGRSGTLLCPFYVRTLSVGKTDTPGHDGVAVPAWVGRVQSGGYAARRDQRGEHQYSRGHGREHPGAGTDPGHRVPPSGISTISTLPPSPLLRPPSHLTTLLV